MAKVDPISGSNLSPVARRLWLIFVVWSGIGGLVMFLGVSATDIVDAEAKPQIFFFLDIFDRHADAVWMFLAAAALFAFLVPAWGESVTWWQLLFIGGVTGMIETVGVLTGFPFGDYSYTDRYGLRLFGTLPLAIPFAWFVVVASGGAAVRSLAPRAGRGVRALAVATIALVTDLNLEPIAWKLRGYWVWYPDLELPPRYPPLSNFLAWFVIAFLLALALPARQSPAAGRRPLYLLLVLHGVLLLGHLGVLLRE